MSSQPQVLIVGAGPCGLVAALVLRRNGIAVRLIDKALDYQIGVRGNGIQPRILELFKTLGLVTDIVDNSFESPQMRAYDGKNVLRTWDFAEKVPVTPAVPYPNPRLLSQATTEAILRSHLTRLGVTVELGTELVNFTQDEHRVNADLLKCNKDGSSENETLEVDWVIGADGARGVTRKALGVNFLGETLEKQAFLVAEMEMEGLDRDYWAAYGNAATGLLLILPLGPAPAFSLVGSGSPEEIQKVADGDFDAFKLYLSNIMKDDSLVLTKLVRKSYFRPNIRCADKFNVGRIFIAGDGAHIHSPAGGQGLNSAIQDSVNLAWKLSLVIKGFSPRSLLETYETERMPIIKEALNLTTQLHTNLMSGTAIASKDTSKPVNPGFQRGKILSQLGVNYQWSEIILDEHLDVRNAGSKVHVPYGDDNEPLQAGDRAPDAPGLVPAEGGEPATLLDLLTPTAHTALVFESPTNPRSQPAILASTKDIFQALETYNRDGHRLVQSYLVLSKDALPTGSGELAGVNQVFVDSEGHARTAYDVGATQAHQAFPVVVIVRPDTYIGAFVHDAKGVEKYFSKIFV